MFHKGTLSRTVYIHVSPQVAFRTRFNLSTICNLKLIRIEVNGKLVRGGVTRGLAYIGRDRLIPVRREFETYQNSLFHSQTN